MNRWIFFLVLPVLLGGCINVGLGSGDPPPEMRFHVLDSAVLARAAREPAAKAPAGPVLAVRTFDVITRYDMRVVKRPADGIVEYEEFQRWADEPFEAATLGVREVLATSGSFAGVLRGSSEQDSDLVLDGYLLHFEVDTGGGGPYQAHFVARISLFERSSGRLLDSGIADGTSPLPGRSMEGLGTSMARSVRQSVEGLLGAWKQKGLLD